MSVLAMLPPVIAVAGILTDYVCGRFQSIPIGSFVPAVLLAIGLMLVCWMAALVLLADRVFRRASPLRGLLALITSAAVTAIVISSALRTRPYLVGLRDSVFSAGTADEFRRAAKSIEEMLPSGRSPLEVSSSLPGPGKWSIWDEKRDRQRWARAIERDPCIGRLNESVWIFRNDEHVAFVWGGALMGHSGFRIGRDLTEFGDTETLRYADDFVFFMGQ